jgi:glutamine amidotransferase
MIQILDYGMGNIGSIANMLKKIGAPTSITLDRDAILAADKLILPGVGAFDEGMASLDRLGLIPVLREKVLERRTPVLGICLGMQLMTKSSEEGKLPGLGWVDARTVRFRHEPSLDLKVPHMGWNIITPKKASPLLNNMYPDPRFYFVHSFHAVCGNPDDILTVTTYGYEFISSFQHDNVIGVQFHPEKSHKFGMQLLKNFAEAALC